MYLNDELYAARRNIKDCKEAVASTTAHLRKVLGAFMQNPNVREVFEKTGFGKVEYEKLLGINKKLEKINDSLDKYVPMTIRTIDDQISINAYGGTRAN